jgi:hypothetical protein
MTEREAPVVMSVMSAGQAASWHGLMDLHEKVPAGWTLVGGQLVHLHCAEHRERPTDDIDTVVDVRAASDMLDTFAQALLDLDFKEVPRRRDRDGAAARGRQPGPAGTGGRSRLTSDRQKSTRPRKPACEVRNCR